MLLRLYVCVLEGRDLPVNNSRVKLKLGKLKSKTTRILRNTCNPIWNQEFVFKVQHLQEQDDVLLVSVVDESKLIKGSVHFVGQVRIPLRYFAFQEKQTLPPTWFSLQSPNTGKFFNKYSGLFLSFPHYKHFYFYLMHSSLIEFNFYTLSV